MLQTSPLTSSSRRKRFGPKSRIQRAKLGHAASRGADPETIDKLRAELDVVRAIEDVEAAEAGLIEATRNTDVDYDSIVADWPELGDERKAKLASLLRTGHE